LLSTGDLYWNGTETVDGETVVHISGVPTGDGLEEGVANGQGVSSFDDENVDSVRFDAWLDNETYRPKRTKLTAAITADGQSGTVTVTTRY